ncbi:DUF4097 family beta strand repeat protein [Salinimonas marina]|uniref:DUF4097 family beta strand repeat protein n=1 Tax=Salinimonas marina TaxID=2785918 RepID=A0A7S9DXN9_9ALTE|nr:DUF4097 family beta strand repeat-containing protein [Salinimonas marina]QPG05878.1 DUF4097 family beta strand repeat protein [Salinimonas marina]
MKLISGLVRPFGTVTLTMLLSSMSLVALAQQKIDESVQTSASPNVEIEHVSGEAEIIVWDKNQVSITGTLGKNTESYEFEKLESGVRFEVDTKRYRGDWNTGHDRGDDLVIKVPAGSRVFYTAVNADVDISGITNSTEVDLVNGDITASGLSGRTKLETVNGDIEFENVAGELMIETVNGDIEGQHTGGERGRFITVNGDIEITTQARNLRLDSVNGDIDFVTEEIEQLDIVTVNGTVNGEVTLSNKGDLSASSVGGEISLTFQQEVAARFELQGHAGGDIENNLTDATPSKAKYGPSQWLEFTTGDGSARVEMSTVHGTLELNKR